MLQRVTDFLGTTLRGAQGAQDANVLNIAGHVLRQSSICIIRSKVRNASGQTLKEIVSAPPNCLLPTCTEVIVNDLNIIDHLATHDVSILVKLSMKDIFRDGMTPGMISCLRCPPTQKQKRTLNTVGKVALFANVS